MSAIVLIMDAIALRVWQGLSEPEVQPKPAQQA